METKRTQLAIPLLCGLVALVLVCHWVPMGHELTGDEAHSARVAALPLGELIDFVAGHDLHPPLYYVLLGAVPAHDAGVLQLRLLSFLAGLLHLFVFWMLGRRMGGARLGWVFVAFAGVTLLFCRHGALARNYVVLQLFMTSAWLVMVGALEKGGAWRWALIAVSYALACLTFYYAAHAIIALSVFFLAARPARRQLGAYAAACAAAVLLFAAWLPSLVDQLERVRTLTASGVAAPDWSVGWIADRYLRRHLSIGPWGSVWALVAVACAFVPLYVHRRWFRAEPPDAQAASARRWLAPTLWASGAYLLAVLASMLAGSFLRPRYAGFLGTLLIAAVALALIRLPRRVCLVLAVAITIGGATHTITRSLRHKDLGAQAATERILAHEAEGDVVLCMNPDGRLLYDFHRSGSGPRGYGVYLDPPRDDAPAWEAPALALNSAASIQTVLRAPRRIWVLWLMPELSGPEAEQRLRDRLASRGWRSVEGRSWPRGVRLERFER